jgi:hypothetical protein
VLVSQQVMSAGTMPAKKTFAMLPAEEENFYYYFFLAAGSWLVLLALQVLKSS